MRWSCGLAAAACCFANSVHAGEIVTGLPPSVTAPTIIAAPIGCGCVVVPALMIVDIEILAPLSSATSKDGEIFPIKLASPIVVAGRTVVPAGAKGVGEVIHAQKSGMGGGGGELLLAARYLEVDGRRLRLRSFSASRFGKNQTDTALMTSVFLGVFGLAVKGKNTEIPASTMASAKVAEAFEISFAALPEPSHAISENKAPETVPTEPITKTAKE